MRFILLITLLLPGCVGLTSALTGNITCPTVSSSVPPVSEAELRKDWVDRFGPLKSSCSAVWDWSLSSAADMAKSCPNDAGCTTFTIGPNGTRDPGCPLSMFTAQYAHDRRLAAHEIAHWFLHCSSTTGDGDPGHTDPTVWGKDGFVPSFPSP